MKRFRHLLSKGVMSTHVKEIVKMTLKGEANHKPVPKIEPHEIFEIMSKIKTNKSTIKNDRRLLKLHQ